MIELPHTLVGTAIAIKIGNPALALPLALASHFVLDLLPHWNPHLNKEIKEYGKITTRTKVVVAADVVVSLISGLYIASQFLPDTTRAAIIVAGAFLAVLPDTVEGPYFFFGWKNRWITGLIRLQSKLQFNVPLIPGIISQVLVAAAALWWMNT